MILLYCSWTDSITPAGMFDYWILFLCFQKEPSFKKIFQYNSNLAAELTDWYTVFTFTPLRANSAGDKLVTFFVFFPENKIWHVNSCFLGKIRKILQYVVCWKLYPECLALQKMQYRVILLNSTLQLRVYRNRLGLFRTDLCTKPLLVKAQKHLSLWPHIHTHTHTHTQMVVKRLDSENKCLSVQFYAQHAG